MYQKSILQISNMTQLKPQPAQPVTHYQFQQ